MATTSVNTIFIVGPTASGKSALAMQLALYLGAEIICADSQTIRRGLNIGTAKPSPADQQQVPHHLLDIIGPYDDYSAAQFKKDATAALNNIHARGKIAIVVGGTGLYVDALFFDYSFRKVPKDARLREVLAGESVEQLQTRIAKKGLPLPANSKNPRHLIRTLESGGLAAVNKTPRAGSIIVGLNPGREAVVHNIKARVNSNFKHGFITEVKQLLTNYGTPSRRFDAIAYKVAYEHLTERPDEPLSKLVEAVVTAECQYAKRQISWFKRNPHTHWFAVPTDAFSFVISYLYK